MEVVSKFQVANAHSAIGHHLYIDLICICVMRLHLYEGDEEKVLSLTQKGFEKRILLFSQIWGTFSISKNCSAQNFANKF